MNGARAPWPDYNLITALLPLFVTQILAPSKATADGFDPTSYVPSTVPSLALSLVPPSLSRDGRLGALARNRHASTARRFLAP